MKSGSGPLFACVLSLSVCTRAAAEGPAPSPPRAIAELESRAAAAEGLEKARQLASLAERLRTDDPARAIEHGTAALALLARHPDSGAQVQALNAVAWGLLQRGDFAGASARATEARELAGRAGDRPGLARALNNLGVIAQRSGNAVVAIGYFEQSLQIYRALGSRIDVANALNNLGFVHGTDLADYATSLEYHVEALAVREALGDRNAVALSLNNIGIVYARLGEHARALEYFDRSLALRRAVGAVNRTAGTLSNIGDVHLEAGALEKAFDYHRQSLDIRRSLGETAGVANSLKNIGNIYAAMGRPADARRHLQDALATSRRIHDRTTESQALLGLASLEHRLGRGAVSADLASRALSIARGARSRELERRALEQLASAEELAGRPARALAAHKKFKALEDLIFAEDKARRVDILERRYQARKQEAENDRLRAEQVVGALQASRSRLQRNAMAGAGLFGLAIGVILYRRRVDAARLAAELSVTDALTGLRNRRYIHQTIEADVAAAVRAARTDPNAGLVFMLLDADHFKAVNDTHGHRAGDIILSAIAGILRGTCRASDTIARWGGEEFLLLCRATPPRDAAVLAERVREAIEAFPFTVDGGTAVRMTCSIGFASLPYPGKDLTWEQALELADEALYQAKRQGRNRWVDALDLDRGNAVPPQPFSGAPATA